MSDKVKRANEVLDFDFDFAPVTNGSADDGGDYLETGETLASKTVTVSGATKDSDVLINTNTGVKVWISAGITGGECTITCEGVTSNTPPRTVVRSMTVKIVANSYH